MNDTMWYITCPQALRERSSKLAFIVGDDDWLRSEQPRSSEDASVASVPRAMFHAGQFWCSFHFGFRSFSGRQKRRLHRRVLLLLGSARPCSRTDPRHCRHQMKHSLWQISTSKKARVQCPVFLILVPSGSQTKPLVEARRGPVRNLRHVLLTECQTFLYPKGPKAQGFKTLRAQQHSTLRLCRAARPGHAPATGKTSGCPRLHLLPCQGD